MTRVQYHSEYHKCAKYSTGFKKPGSVNWDTALGRRCSAWRGPLWWAKQPQAHRCTWPPCVLVPPSVPLRHREGHDWNEVALPQLQWQLPRHPAARRVVEQQSPFRVFGWVLQRH